MDALERILLPCKNAWYDKNYIAIDTTAGSKQSYLLNVRKESTFLKRYARALSNHDLVFHFEVTLDSMMEHCLFFDVNYNFSGTTLQDAQNLYLAVTKEIRHNMELPAEKGTDKFLDCAFLLSRNDSFRLIFPFLQISRLDYDILVRRMIVVTGGGGGHLNPEIQGLTLFGSTEDLKKPPHTIDGFFRHGEPSLHTDVIKLETLRNEFVEVAEEKLTNRLGVMETYVNLFYPRESKFRRKRMCHIRYPLIVNLHEEAENSLLNSGGKLVVSYFERNVPLTFMYSVLKSNLNDDSQYEKFKHSFVLRWAKEHQNVFIFQDVCDQVWTCFNKFYPPQLPKHMRRGDNIPTLQRERKAENQRRYIERLKSDPCKKEKYLQREIERRKRRKESGKVMSIKELTETQKFYQRIKWREYQQKCRRKKLQEH